jgi:1-deoxy-D-xylulose-5-phosphate synthase
VVFTIDRAGLVGEDGATHQGVFDMAIMRSIPNMIVSAPMDEKELRNLMFTASTYTKSLFSIRYSKNSGTNSNWQKASFESVLIGKGRKISDGQKAALVTIGYAGVLAQKAILELEKENIHPAHYDMRFLKPIDEELLTEAFRKYDQIITIEDGSINGGLGDAVLDFKEKYHFSNPVIKLGVPDQFIPHGSRKELYEVCGYGPESICKLIKNI